MLVIRLVWGLTMIRCVTFEVETCVRGEYIQLWEFIATGNLGLMKPRRRNGGTVFGCVCETLLMEFDETLWVYRVLIYEEMVDILEKSVAVFG